MLILMHVTGGGRRIASVAAQALIWQEQSKVDNSEGARCERGIINMLEKVGERSAKLGLKR
jgi:hypothetical protein